MNKPITPEEMKAYVDATWERCQSEAWAEKQGPVAKCAQCKKEYAHCKTGGGCPKCAPNVHIAESEFQKPITPEPAQPCPREWHGLAAEEIWKIYFDLPSDDSKISDLIGFARAIEAKCKENNT